MGVSRDYCFRGDVVFFLKERMRPKWQGFYELLIFCFSRVSSK